MREEEASTSRTPGEICIQKVHGIPGNMKGVAAPKKQILVVEKLKTEIGKERKKAAEAEERSIVLVDKVAAQEEEMNLLKEQMGTVVAELARLARLQAGENVSANYKFCCLTFCFRMITSFAYQ